MPLDGAELFANPTLAKLWEVECLLATEDQWCKGRLQDRKGRHCLVGAVIESNGRQELTRPIMCAIKEVSGKHYWRIESFNDDPGTNHLDVLRVLHRARLIIISEIARAKQPKPWYAKLFETMNQVSPLSISRSPDHDTGDPVRVPVEVNHAARPDTATRPPDRVRETVDVPG